MPLHGVAVAAGTFRLVTTTGFGQNFSQRKRPTTTTTARVSSALSTALIFLTTLCRGLDLIGGGGVHRGADGDCAGTPRPNRNSGAGCEPGSRCPRRVAWS